LCCVALRCCVVLCLLLKIAINIIADHSGRVV
jgi:hypothetical protein